MNAAARLKLLRGEQQPAATEQRARVEPAPSPAERLLLQVRAWKQAAYVCDADRAGRWHVDCPACGRERGVTITELAEDGPIVMACATGCARPAIREALDRATTQGDETDWREIALEAQAICHRQAELIDHLLGRDQPSLDEAA